ncbi:hypothetical protein [cf. Phormidesmis sp. LEGE 11477]|uniref:hypothetical protein n=1 Tax=cf. Phormidesmis sp. LEGE 11477 TaxID=1828680 RepID=UPI00188065F1|nr:hypothetical protein [cf. Phormidesmis sp. LEGE 11477]MBE9064212.1 hypothetical protein [cf. Phormidesmis sp. LEGE 11477]
MKYWEFLIQKEGDQTWLPLETHQVEILAGRYRVIAHTNRTNTPVDIRVSQLVTTETLPRKRVRDRASQTNEAGLVVVVPYVHLEPGQWELTCSSQDIADGLDSWQYSLQIQVFAPAEEGWPADSPTLSEAEIEALDKSLLFDSAAAVNQDLPLIQAQSQLRAQSLHARADVEAEAIYGISLRQRAFLAQDNQPMTIVGQVQALSPLFEGQSNSQLWLRLQDPETARVIMEAHRPINLARLPADFKVKIQLPARVTTRIVLGEVSLRPDSPEAETSGAVLSAAAFTITAGIAQTLDETANSDPSSASLDYFDEEHSASSPTFSQLENADYADPLPLGDSLPLAAPPVSVGVHSPSPAIGVVLPPRIDLPVSANSTGRIDLPSFLPSNLLLVSDSPKAQPVGSPEAQPVGSPEAQSTSSPEARPVSSLKAQLQQDSQPADLGSPDTTNGELDSGPNGLVLDLDKPGLHEPDLHEPDLDRPHSSPSIQLPPMVTKPAQFMGTSIEDDDIETAQIAALLEDINDDLETATPSSDASRPSDSSFLSTTPDSSNDPADESESLATEAESDHANPKQKQETVKTAFRSLKLKDHFMQRLSDLTHDEISQSAKLTEELQSAGVSLESPQTAEPLEIFANSEVVIFDEPSAAEEELPASPAIPIAPLGSATEELAEEFAAELTEEPAEEFTAEFTSEFTSELTKERYADPSNQRLLPQSAAAVIPSSFTDLDRNRQLRLERLRQRQLAAKSPRVDHLLSLVEPAAPLPSAPTHSPAPNSGLSPIPAPEPEAASVLTLRRNFVEAVEELPEMVIPIISVPRGDLIAGDRVTITVRTRPSVFRPFIKLWMIDRQSRTLVGEPKLLSNLKPDALGDLQTSTEMLVPMGCLDVQIAAIAIDMATQQESNKAIVNRHVIPAVQSLPPLRSLRAREW